MTGLDSATLRTIFCVAAILWLMTGCAGQPQAAHRGQVRYPVSAIRNKEEGTAVVKIRMKRDGTVEDTTLEKSSGWADLDQAALAAVQSAGKFTPVADDVFPEQQEFTFTLPISFSLNH
jgi:TonB family protein